ncbi:Multiple epidermal growth factor-like domains 6 [Salmo salar]|uniref:Multiple epidermal growth factor-like domains 6 n=1 Tax=Salmo salar TaxID=8030 RepID=B5X5Y1_SALSA|nr:Multiple epidermal growth factor-like domains 6 [Salmo salar]ACI66251.1 Multiple epidermal growth factor-like domains 6 precursor [Salmo salar]|eukprot:NP_001134109.1 Multiple epidermal growth factor-like domains 6 [Salmo salar]
MDPAPWRDMNECEETNGGCEALCCNTIGSFCCKCPLGQELMEDGKTCQAEVGHSFAAPIHAQQ